MRQTNRNSSFELLRIISMLLIIMHHYSIHSAFNFMLPFSTKLFFVQCLQMGGKLGVNLFILISGYFLCKTEFKWERILKLEFEVIFYSVIIGLIFYIFMPERESLKALLNEFIPLRSYKYWFYNTYLMMILFSPAINKLIVSLEKNAFKKLLLIITVIWVLVPIFPNFCVLPISYLGWFIFLYFCAAYIRLYQEDFHLDKRYFVLFGILIYILVLLSVLAFDFLGFIDKRFQSKFAYFSPMNSILIFSSSIILFIGFAKIDMGSKRIINILSSATFGIYLIHDNHLLRPFLWIDLFRNADFINSNRIFLQAFIAITSVYAVCTIIDLIRQYILEKPMFLIIEKIRKSWDNRKYNNITNHPDN